MSIRTARNGQPTGVWELPALQAAVDGGEVKPTDLVWTKGFQDWKQLSKVAEEIGISLPVLEEGVPPIPGSAERTPPPIPKSVKREKASAGTSEKQDFGELKFRKVNQVGDKKGEGGIMQLLLALIALMAIAGLIKQVWSGTAGNFLNSGSELLAGKSPSAIEDLFKPLSRHIKVQNCRASSTYRIGTDCTVLFTCGTGLGNAFGLHIDMSNFQIAQYRQGVRLSEDLKMIADVRVDEPTVIHIFGDVDNGADEYRLFMQGEEVKEGSVLFNPSNPFYKNNICPI